MVNYYTDFEKQMNLLIGFLEVSSVEVYSLIQNHDTFNIGITIDFLYKEYENFRKHITNSALIMAFTHIEDFISKIYSEYMWLKGKEQKIGMNLNNFDKSTTIENLVRDHARQKPLETKIKDLSEYFFRKDREEDKPFIKLCKELQEFRKVRNSLIHNNGIAQENINCSFNLGDEIMLDVSQLNDIGSNIRKLFREIHNRLMCIINNK